MPSRVRKASPARTCWYSAAAPRGCSLRSSASSRERTGWFSPTRPDKLTIANSAGVAEAVAPGALGADRFDVVIEAAGARAALLQAIDLVQKTGVLVQVGFHGEHDTVPFNPFHTYERELRIIGSNSLADQFPAAVEVTSDIAGRARPLIDDSYRVWDFGAAVDEMAKGRTIETQLRFGDQHSQRRQPRWRTAIRPVTG